MCRHSRSLMTSSSFADHQKLDFRSDHEQQSAGRRRGRPFQMSSSPWTWGTSLSFVSCRIIFKLFEYFREKRNVAVHFYFPPFSKSNRYPTHDEGRDRSWVPFIPLLHLLWLHLSAAALLWSAILDVRVLCKQWGRFRDE